MRKTNNFLRVYKRIRNFLICCGLAFMGIVSAQAQGVVSADQQVWDRYVNQRFGVISDVPRVGFYTQLPSDNGDGQSYIDDTGEVEIRIFGSYWDVLADQFADYKEMQRDYLLDSGADITYSPSGKSWFVFSGYLDNKIFYLKATTRSGCSVAGQIDFLYPKVERKAMSSIIERMEDTLFLGDSMDCPSN